MVKVLYYVVLLVCTPKMYVFLLPAVLECSIIFFGIFCYRHTAGYVENLSSTLPNLNTGVTLLKLLSTLSDKIDSDDIKAKISEFVY